MKKLDKQHQKKENYSFEDTGLLDIPQSVTEINLQVKVCL